MALIWNLTTYLQAQRTTTISVPYSGFVSQLRDGNVAAVTITGATIQGQFREPMTAAGLGITPTPGMSGTPPAATPGAAADRLYAEFTTVGPANADEQLMPILEERGVTVTIREARSGSWLFDLLVGLLPTAVLIGLLVLMARQAGRGQQALFGFGASRARRYTADRPSITFADVAGEDAAKQELLEIVDFLKRPDYYHKLGARLPRGVLLLGPPGTGKTLLARATAGEANVPFFSISASEFVEMIVGVGASRVRDLFAKAKAEAPSIIFVDEIDAVGRQRGAAISGAGEEREQTLNQLLVEMDGFDPQENVIVLAATNRPDVLDPALLRPGRFDRQVNLELPDRAGRTAILRIHTRGLPLTRGVDLDALARRTPGFSGADLANLANEAALAAARRGGTDIGVTDFDDALDKIILGIRHAGLMNEDERRLVAYHESGHALVARFTPGADPVNKVTIIPHGRALGVTEQLAKEDRHGYTKDYLCGRLAGMLAGRAAENLVFGQPATGAESDLKQATALARRMVTVWAMSDDLGLGVYSDEGPYQGLPGSRAHADETAADIDQAVEKLLGQGYARALAILTNKRHLLDLLANELLAHETVDAQQLDALLEPAATMDTGAAVTAPT
ncbi:MAG: ATP-dependent zinc metalloprotease FtsH [Chloroflexota bacterium]